MFNIPGMTKDSHPDLRQSAKSALLGAGYGLGWASFAQQLLTGFLGAPPVRYNKDFARKLGVAWAGGTDQRPPELLDAAILYAPDGRLVPLALSHLRKGGRVVCAGIHMSDIPSFSYDLLWGEREVMSVANLTRQDGLDFLAVARKFGVKTRVTLFPLQQANQALDDLRAGRFDGAAVLIP